MSKVQWYALNKHTNRKCDACGSVRQRLDVTLAWRTYQICGYCLMEAALLALNTEARSRGE